MVKLKIFDDSCMKAIHKLIIYVAPADMSFKIVLCCTLCRACHRERGGIVVERQNPNREVPGLIPTSGTVFCP